MARRYGRNQKRAHRQRIAELELLYSKERDEAVIARANAFRASARLAEAKAVALEEFIKQSGMVEAVMNRFSRELAQALAPELIEPARKILSTAREPVPCFTAQMDRLDPNIVVLRGSIPRLDYNIALTTW